MSSIHRFLFSISFIVATTIAAQKNSITELELSAPVLKHCTEVKDQYLSGTCWSFASNSLLESELMKKGKGKTDLSEMFVARYSMIRKIKRHLELKGKNYFTPGGQFHDVMWVIRNYGMVPEEVYSGKTNGSIHHDHSLLDTLLAQSVKKMLAEGKTTLEGKDLTYIHQLLDAELGKVPTRFMYKGKEYTALTYAKEYLQVDPSAFIEITSYTHQPFYKPFILEDKYNWTGDMYHNVPVKDFIAITNYALQQGFTVGWDGDVDEPGFDFTNAVANLPDIVKDLSKERQETFADHSTDIDHLMHIVGKVKDKKGADWYYVKNSWGKENASGGFMFMSADYFAVKTVAIIVNKKAIPDAIRKKMSLK